MPEYSSSRDDLERRYANAGNEARRAVQQLARDSGAEIISRPLVPGSDVTVRDVEPLAGARAARDIELGARRHAHDYIRAAREAGHSWHQIGHALGLAPESEKVRESIADAAYAYAAGSPDTDFARRYGRSFIWRCPSCDQTIGDRGIVAGPAEDERGHSGGCQRLAAAVAAWDAQWEAEP